MDQIFKLRPFSHFIPDEVGEMQIRIPGKRFLLKGGAVTQLFPHLIPLLRAGDTLEGLLGQLAPIFPTISAGEVIEVLDHLKKMGLFQQDFPHFSFPRGTVHFIEGGELGKRVRNILGEWGLAGWELHTLPEVFDGAMAETDEKSRGEQWLFFFLEEPDYLSFEKVNRTSLAQGFSWMPAHLDFWTGVIGPAVLPNRTPCYQCFRTRLKSHLVDVDREASFERYLHGSQDPIVPAEVPFLDLFAHHLALEILKLTQPWIQPVSLGSVAVLSLFNMKLEMYPILKLPRCVACSPVRHHQQIYEP